MCEQRGLARHVRVIERSPFLTLPGDADAVDAALSAKRRSGLRRLARRLDARGAVTLDVRGGDEELDALLDEGFAVERSGWKGRRGTGIADDATTRAFYTHVARWAAGRGWLRLGFLRLDGRAIAFDLALEAGRVHYLLKTGYDESLRSLAPGILLRHAMIRRAAAEGCRRYEFLGHEAPWKREWARETHARLQLHLFPATPEGRADRLLVAGLLPLGLRVRAGLGR